MRIVLQRYPAILLLALGLASTPSVGTAQVLGTVTYGKDASGAVLPGVTVEASSPALIEKVRTAVTDGAGQYRINLPPGAYVITFTLTDSYVRREGVDLSINVTSTIDADMRVAQCKRPLRDGWGTGRRSSVDRPDHRGRREDIQGTAVRIG
jgi:hypothetical protein